MAEHVLVLVVDAHDVGGRAGDQPGSELVAHLARHEVKARAAAGCERRRRIAEALLAQAREEAADLLVMGGYGHSRLREMMLGGTTRSILEQHDRACPVLALKDDNARIPDQPLYGALTVLRGRLNAS